MRLLLHFGGVLERGGQIPLARLGQPEGQAAGQEGGDAEDEHGEGSPVHGLFAGIDMKTFSEEKYDMSTYVDIYTIVRNLTELRTVLKWLIREVKL